MLKNAEGKNQVKKIVTGFVFVFILSSASANAAVEVGENLSLFGDVRFRLETDDRENGSERDRARIRARLGVRYTVDDNWSMRIRLATGANSANSSHQTMGNGGSENFGLDQAFIQYDRNAVNGKFGKVATDYWAASEVVFDGDAQDEGAQLGYKLGPVDLHAGYFIETEANWENGPSGNQDDASYGTFQAIYSQPVGDMKLKVAAGMVKLSAASYASNKHTSVSAQLKGEKWRIAADYVKGDPEGVGTNDSEDTAIVVQGRYQVTDKIGLRLYHYTVQAYSVPGDGAWSQDNFPNPGSAGVTNFKGIRAQVDIKVASNVGLDIRYYDMEPETKTGILPVDACTDERERVQMNLNVKF